MTTDADRCSCHICRNHHHQVSVRLTAGMLYNPVLHETYQNVQDIPEHFLELFIFTNCYHAFCKLLSNVTLQVISQLPICCMCEYDITCILVMLNLVPNNSSCPWAFFRRYYYKFGALRVPKKDVFTSKLSYFTRLYYMCRGLITRRSHKSAGDPAIRCTATQLLTGSNQISALLSYQWSA